MEKLLHWSIANSQGDKETVDKIGQPDPKLLAQLFGSGGPDDPTLMKEAIAVISNPEADLENKLIAFDNFEMLIENLDNANNIENIKLWVPLLKTLDAEQEDLRASGLSVIGTAAQNNIPTQDSFLKYDNGLRKLIELGNDLKEPANVRIKAFYALSNLVRNHPSMAQKFKELGGLDIVAPVLTDLNAISKLKMRAISLVAAFLTSTQIDDELIQLLRTESIIGSTIECLKTETDINIIDRVLNFLSQLISAHIKFSEAEVQGLKTGIQNIEQWKDRLNEEDFSVVKHVL